MLLPLEDVYFSLESLNLGQASLFIGFQVVSLFLELIFLIQDHLIHFVDFLFSHVCHTTIKLVSGCLEFVQFFFELFVRLNHIVYLFERFLVLALEIYRISPM